MSEENAVPVKLNNPGFPQPEPVTMEKLIPPKPKVSNMFAAFGTDKAAEKEGVWFTAFEDDNGVETQFKIVKLTKTNESYHKLIRKMGKRFSHIKDIPLSVIYKIERTALCRILIKDWRNVQEWRTDQPQAAGELVSFTPENAIALLTEFEDLFDMLADAVKDPTVFRTKDESIEDDDIDEIIKSVVEDEKGTPEGN